MKVGVIENLSEDVFGQYMLNQHFRGNREKLAWKYREELHANEVAILPYYVANLNIEATYQAITGQFAEFPGLVFVDTLDNVDALGIYAGYQHDLLGAIADENAERIKRQNRRKISIVIGNPPYNANQQSENQDNKNRRYDRVDQRIRQTYLKSSKATKTKLFDPYVRFIRWASDRLSDDGIVAFITNRSFVDAFGFDGFRRHVFKEFAEGWVVDLGGDYKRDDYAGGGNVFSIGTGVAISFWVRRKKPAALKLRYLSCPPGSGEDKLAWLDRLTLSDAVWTDVPDRADAAWVGISEENTEGFLPLADRATKAREDSRRDRAIFKLFSLGVSTNRDDWLYDRNPTSLENKVQHFISVYDSVRPDADGWTSSIKWSRNLKRRLAQRKREPFSKALVAKANYRPFSPRWLYQSELFVDEMGLANRFFPPGSDNIAIVFSDKGSRAAFCVQAITGIADLHYGASLDGYQQVARFRYLSSGERVDNVTDWAVRQFEGHYGKKTGVTKDAIFAYCYAVLHDPLYREKYARDLKREFPRIPFYDDFTRWAGWGHQLLQLHIGFEDAKPFTLKRVDIPSPKRASGSQPKARLRSEPDQGSVAIDDDTVVTGIPPEAWEYRLGNRAAIDWVLDQHKEKTPRDPTVREKFNSYCFADYKDSMIDLLSRVVTVSLETRKITEAMRACERRESVT